MHPGFEEAFDVSPAAGYGPENPDAYMADDECSACERIKHYKIIPQFYDMLRLMHFQCLSDWKSVPELSQLLDLPNPPKQLFYVGEFQPELFVNCVAIVGSRRITEYGRRAIEMIVPKLVFEKKTIVSGFMYGVDQYAHEVAVKNGGRTVAVFGWGINQKLEDGDLKLAESIVSSCGLLMSEWEDQKPTLWTFPVRNRIVAALCTDVIVIEAAEKSGSLITANIAYKLKRNLWAVPGPITSRTSAGTNALIAEGKAKMWLDQPAQRALSDDPVLRALGDDALTTDELARSLGAPVSEIGAQLSMLTLTGDVVERGGKYHARQN